MIQVWKNKNDTNNSFPDKYIVHCKKKHRTHANGSCQIHISGFSLKGNQLENQDYMCWWGDWVHETKSQYYLSGIFDTIKEAFEYIYIMEQREQALEDFFKTCLTPTDFSQIHAKEGTLGLDFP